MIIQVRKIQHCIGHLIRDYRLKVYQDVYLVYAEGRCKAFTVRPVRNRFRVSMNDFKWLARLCENSEDLKNTADGLCITIRNVKYSGVDGCTITFYFECSPVLFQDNDSTLAFRLKSVKVDSTAKL